MALVFHYLSGSPFAWKVWLSLEHKGVSYTLDVLKRDAGDLETERYLAINPRGKAPAIVHDGFALYESGAIVEYLEESFTGPSLWPRDRHDRAIARRMMAESDLYLYPPIRRMVEELLSKDGSAPNHEAVHAARELAAENLAFFAGWVKGPFLAGALPSAADYSLYALTAILMRLDERDPHAGLDRILPARLGTWREEIQALPYFAETWPPHWAPASSTSATGAHDG